MTTMMRMMMKTMRLKQEKIDAVKYLAASSHDSGAVVGVVLLLQLAQS